MQYSPGRRIAEFWRTVGPRQTGEMTPRELCVIVNELPDTSRYKRARVHAWSLAEELAAGAVNVLQAYRRDYRNAHGAEHEWTAVTAPELEHERIIRERAEYERAYQDYLRTTVYDKLLHGQLSVADIDMTKSVEEVLAAA